MINYGKQVYLIEVSKTVQPLAIAVHEIKYTKKIFANVPQ